MATADRGALRIAVRINPAVWQEEVERFTTRSAARVAAERERRGLDREGVTLTELIQCSEEGPDATRIARLVKTYVPISDAPPSERPFAFVFSPGRDEAGLYLALVAFGERHPRPGTRSVYERAHKRLYGHYPDEGQ